MEFANICALQGDDRVGADLPCILICATTGRPFV